MPDQTVFAILIRSRSVSDVGQPGDLVAFLFVYPLIVDKRLTAVPAISTSCRAVWANLGGIVLTMFLYGIIACASVLACGIGTIFVTPVMFGALAILYRQIFPERPPLHDFAPFAEA